MADEKKTNNENEDGVFRVINNSEPHEEKRASFTPPIRTENFGAWADEYTDLAPPPPNKVSFADFLGHDPNQSLDPQPQSMENLTQIGETTHGPRADLYGEVVRSSNTASSGKKVNQAAQRAPSGRSVRKNPRSNGNHAAGRPVRKDGRNETKPSAEDDLSEGITIRAASAKSVQVKNKKRGRPRPKKKESEEKSELLSTPKESLRYEAEQKRKKEGELSPRTKRRAERKEQELNQEISREQDIMENTVGSSDKKKSVVINIKKEEKEKKKRTKLIVCGIAGVIFVIIVLAFIIGVVRECKVVNTDLKTYSDDTIQLKSGIVENKTRSLTLLIRSGSIKKNLTKELPYLDSVKIKFDSPYNVTLTVRETSDKFCLVDGETQIWIDEKAKILDNKKKKLGKSQAKVYGFNLEGKTFDVGVPLVFKKEDAEKDKEKEEIAETNAAYLEILKRIAKGIKKSGLKISRIDFYSTGKICMTMNKVIKIYAKGENDFSKKLAGVKDLLGEVGEVNTDFYFDIREKDKIIYNYGTLY